MTKKQHKKKKSFWKQIRFRYKLSFFNESTLEEVFSFRVSQLSAFVAFVFLATILITVTSLVIIKTPIRNYLPGYLDAEVRNEIITNRLRADSLENLLQIQSKYLENVTAIITGDVTLDSIQQTNAVDFSTANYDIPRTKGEERFVRSFEEEEKYNLTALNPHAAVVEGLFFYKPVKGVVSSPFDIEQQHYGIDLVSGPNESILATLDGMVVFTGFDPKFGHVIALQHKNDFISIYKHNELLLKRVGDRVIAGEAIALVGNTGELSTGPHLHFELWHKGTSVNPEEYIAF